MTGLNLHALGCGNRHKQSLADIQLPLLKSCTPSFVSWVRGFYNNIQSWASQITQLDNAGLDIRTFVIQMSSEQGSFVRFSQICFRITGHKLTIYLGAKRSLLCFVGWSVCLFKLSAGLHRWDFCSSACIHSYRPCSSFLGYEASNLFRV